jgi:uncharacterized OB-fold protein
METWQILLAIGLIVIFAIVIIIYYMATRRKSEVEAVEVDRRQGGRREMVPFDEDMEEALYRRRVVCPDCGDEVDPYDENCPSCGARMTFGEFECSNCGEAVDPRDKECPKCGEILLPDPFVCPSCSKPVEADATRCDNCGARFWSPIRLDEKAMKDRLKKFADDEEKAEPEEEEARPKRRRAYR